MRQTEKRKTQILQVLAGDIQKRLIREHLDFGKLQEIRLRVGKPFTIVYDGEERMLCTDGEYDIITKEQLMETIEYISNYSMYAYESEMRQGFLTIEGGHRIGFAGKGILEDGKVRNLKYISSVNIRISHEVPGCADILLPFVTTREDVYHTLIISPPGCGKTTILRDLIRQISDGGNGRRGVSVGVVDERSEIAGCYMGVEQNQLGMRTDILDGCPKAEGMIMLIRSMSPKVLAVDELGLPEDVHAVEYAMHCGCRMLATVHAKDMEEIRRKPLFEQLVKNRRFERYVVLANRPSVGSVREIFDERGNCLFRQDAVKRQVAV